LFYVITATHVAQRTAMSGLTRDIYCCPVLWCRFERTYGSLGTRTHSKTGNVDCCDVRSGYDGVAGGPAARLH